MFEQDRQFSRLVSAQLLIALLAGGAYFLYDQPFESSRSPSGQSPDVFEARLWEDPLSTINNIRDQLIDGNSGVNREVLENNYTIDRKVFISDIKNAADLRGSEGITVLGVMMPEGRNGLSMETRRRIRYAVISALNQSKLPSQSERLPVLNFDKQTLGAETDSLNLLSYEIYNPYSSTLLTEADRLAQTVVVLWLPANLMQGDAIAKYQELLSWIGIEHDQSRLPAYLQTSEIDEYQESDKITLANAVLLGPTNSNELADLYRNFALSKRDYVELEDSVDDIIRDLNIDRQQTLSLLEISEILSIIEISHSYLDYGLADWARQQLATCISDNLADANKVENPLDPEQVEYCLQGLRISDADKNWPAWVKDRWLRQSIARRAVASSAVLNAQQSAQRMESVFDLIDVVDWNLDDGLPSDVDKQSQLAQCGIDLVSHEGLSPEHLALGAQDLLGKFKAIQAELVDCLTELEIEGIDADIITEIASEWFAEEPLEIYLDGIAQQPLREQLEALVGRVDEYLDWGMDFANKLKFVNCSVAKYANTSAEANLNAADIEECLSELSIEDSDPDWISDITNSMATQFQENGGDAGTDGDERDHYVFPRDRIVVLSPRATIPNSLLEEEVGVNGYKGSVLPPQVYRTLDSDEALLTRMIEELSHIRKLRHNDPSVKIALVYEGDGKYGRALQQILNCESIYFNKELEKHLALKAQNLIGEDAEEPPCYDNVDSFAYLRGLDGIRSGDNNSTGSDRPSNSLDSISSFLATSESLEESFGRHQFDYLRRLSNEIARNNYSAIGVLGTDVYDKLLVLQALKEKNQGAVFFTTDLDTTALHGRQFRWTQNLLVASALPLSLNPDIETVQGNSCEYMFPDAADDANATVRSELYAPPFRESYQTAYFQSVCLALHVAESEEVHSSDYIAGLIEDKLTNKTEVYEVGRTNPIMLPMPLQAGSEVSGPSLSSLFNANVFRLSAGWLVLMLPVILLALLSGRSWNIERMDVLDEDLNDINDEEGDLKGITVLTSLIKDLFTRQHEDRASSFDRRLPVSWTLGASCVLSVVSLIFMVGLLITEALTVGGEPLYILEGVSHWPNTLIRIQVLVFCAAFGLYGYARWLKSNRSIDKVLKVKEDKFNNKIKTIPHWLHVIDTANKSKAQKISITEIWRVYRYLGDSKRRWRRVVPRSICWFAIVLFAFVLTPNPALIRESFPLANFLFSSWFLFPLTFSALFLISVTNDVTHLCSVFVRALTKYDVVWDDPEKNGLLPNAFGNYDVLCKPLTVLELIAKRTRAITPLVLFPFGVLFLLVAARSSLFEGWVWSAELIIVYGLVGANSLYFAMRLQKEASGARLAALNELDEMHTMKQFWEADNHSHFDTCVNAAVDYARAVNKGAFVPWFKHPIFQAVMLPFTGATGMLLLQSI